MNRGQVYENFLYAAALAAGCCVLVPLKLYESDVQGQCFLFGELEVLTKTVVTGNQVYCSFVFYSALTNAVLAALLGFLKSCCIIKTNGMRVVYFQFATSVVAALAWINSLVCAIFIVIGFTKWCNSVENNGNVESCIEAQKWDWSHYTPSGIDGTQFYTYLFMVEIASICCVLLWFIIVILSGRNFKQGLLNARLEEYYLHEERLHYMHPQPAPTQDVPNYEVRSDRGSRFL
ncbi:transmembrane protein 179B-like [Montipora capricornis]|uniref:transmembrane protein 179B-like n=1 Tax=Montipora capricornis TaxID=246305 RepID=UPI0035F16A7E